jgi:Ni/Co efflux regulator RcnB
MKIIVIGAAIAAVAALGGAPSEAYAHPDKHHKKYQRAWAGHPHGAPPGQVKKMRRYARGQYLPRTYYTSRTYYIVEPVRYHLRPAPYGYQWVRVGNDVYLTQTRTGLIAQVVVDLLG